MEKIFGVWKVITYGEDGTRMDFQNDVSNISILIDKNGNFTIVHVKD